jgi:hypothetical protein
MRTKSTGHRCRAKGGRDRTSRASGASRGSSILGPFLAAGAVLASISLALTGCSTAAGDSPKSGSAVATYGPRGSDYSQQAALVGELTITGGCVTINAGAVPVFPNIAKWGGTTLHWDGDQYQVGDTIKLGGGEPATELELPAACDASEAFLVQ